MEHDLEATLALLARTPLALDPLLRGLPDVWTRASEGAGTWTVCDVVGHLIEGERMNWMPRARHILDLGERESFPPFDREAHRKEPQGSSLEQQLDCFARVRAGNVRDLRAWNLQPEQLARRGRHPSFGPVTLSQLLATWATHDLTHLHQITRILASQYREAVGPWIRFLGVLQCNGHSAPV